MTMRRRSRTWVRSGRPQSTALLALLVSAAALATSGCPDEAECQRCEILFSWDGEGNFIELDENCEPLDCGVARCGSCFDLEYNSEGLPQRGTCDTCSAETNQCAEDHPNPAPDEEWTYCVHAEPAHCVDVYSNAAHCGECDIACAEGQACLDGACR